MKVLRSLFLIILIVFVGCKGKNKPEDNAVVFWEFKYVKEHVNPKTEEIIYLPTQRKLTTNERDTLVNIIKKNNYNFKVCTDGSVLISKNSINDYDDMLCLSSELKQRMGDTTRSWQYDTIK